MESVSSPQRDFIYNFGIFQTISKIIEIRLLSYILEWPNRRQEIALKIMVGYNVTQSLVFAVLGLNVIQTDLSKQMYYCIVAVVITCTQCYFVCSGIKFLFWDFTIMQHQILSEHLLVKKEKTELEPKKFPIEDCSICLLQLKR